MPWDGPLAGPPAQRDKKVVFIASDLRNGGLVRAYRGLSAAARRLGWRLSWLNGQDSPPLIEQLLRSESVLHADAVVLGGFDAQTVREQVDDLWRRGVVVLGWHAAARPGPQDHLFTNVSTNPEEVARLAANFVIANSKGTAGVVLFNDCRFAVANAKTREMLRLLLACQGCKVLSVEDLPLNRVEEMLPGRVRQLQSKFRSDWTYTLGINDLYFDSMSHPLDRLGVHYMVNVSAGDGSLSAMSRIRDELGQAAAIAEPMNLQGWQLADELNRAFAGVGPSLYVTHPRLVTSEMVRGRYLDIGYDPDNHYREMYLKIWFPRDGSL
jgi:ribose transport system substrate-binding protein